MSLLRRWQWDTSSGGALGLEPVASFAPRRCWSDGMPRLTTRLAMKTSAVEYSPESPRCSGVSENNSQTDGMYSHSHNSDDKYLHSDDKYLHSDEKYSHSEDKYSDSDSSTLPPSCGEVDVPDGGEVRDGPGPLEVDPGPLEAKYELINLQKEIAQKEAEIEENENETAWQQEDFEVKSEESSNTLGLAEVKSAEDLRLVEINEDEDVSVKVESRDEPAPKRSILIQPLWKPGCQKSTQEVQAEFPKKKRKVNKTFQGVLKKSRVWKKTSPCDLTIPGCLECDFKVTGCYTCRAKLKMFGCPKCRWSTYGCGRCRALMTFEEH